MIKTAAPNPTTANSRKEANVPKKEFNPRSQFIGAALSMSWQLAVVVLVPILVGYKLDAHFNSSPLLVIIGFVLAMAGTFFIIRKSFNEFNDNTGGKK